jgi:FMN phosphatase YigB (HAD superfamily)
MIKAIIFDFFGVLVNDDMGQYFDHYLIDPNKRAQVNRLFDMRAKGAVKISDDGFYEKIAKIAGSTIKTVNSSMGSVPNSLLIDYIKQKIKPKYKVGLLSNASDNYFEQLLDIEDAQLFDAVLLSYQHKMIKPQPDFYILVADELDVEPGECVFVDDVKRFCVGAENVGMKSIHFLNNEQFKKDLKNLLADSNN